MQHQLPVAGGGREVIDTISKACAYGDMAKLTEFLDADPSCVNRCDESGYYPLQWAALNNRLQEANHLMQRGALVNATDQTGQTALHWAAVRGSLAVMEVMLAARGDYELRDNRGYTICHVAAQYGQTALLYCLALKWGVDIDTQDSDGRAPLHWAAYKGYSDTVRLLLVLDARYTLADREGCTPLHWAAIKGNGEACTVLLQGGSVSVLTYKDVTGSTPPQLAVEKGHRYLGLHLAEYKQNLDGGAWCGRHGRLAWLSSTQLCPIIWLIVLGLLSLFVYKVMLVPVLPLAGAAQIWAWSVVVSSSLGLFFLYKTTTVDPGFIRSGWDTNGGDDKRGTSGGSDDGAVGLLGGSASGGSDGKTPLLGVSNKHYKALDSPALWAGQWSQLCVSCRIVRPLRAKHCAVSDRCIEVFDHYCPWVGNAIGKGNRHHFLVFLVFMNWTMLASAGVAIYQIRRAMNIDDWAATGAVWMLGFVVADLFMGISVATMAIAQSSQIMRNVTTNELANWHRYKYMQGSNGFTNPFSRGCSANCHEAFHPDSTPMAPVCMPAATQPPLVHGAAQGGPSSSAALPTSTASSSWGGGGGGHVHGPSCNHV